MRRYSSLIAASIIATLAAFGLFARTTLQKRHFDTTVKEALKTSEGYDQQFINMVNRLEYELALRASFGYIGQKDPMTGKERIVVSSPAPFPRRRPAATTPAAVESAPPPAVATPAEDSVRLTAIILDDSKETYTAIVMVGERSFAIEAGDYVVGRRITTINAERVIMEDDRAFYLYEITGRKDQREKFRTTDVR